MIISHRLEFAYFRAPKTGSTTTSLMLRLSNALDMDDLFTPMSRYGLPGTLEKSQEHWTPAQAVSARLITPAQLLQYNCVANLREPRERYMSAYSHSERDAGMMQVEVQRHRDMGILNMPQEDFFTFSNKVVCAPMWYDNFDAELRRVITEIGGTLPLIIPTINPRREPGPVGKLEDYFKNPDSLQRVEDVIQPDVDFYMSMIEQLK